MLIAVVLAYPAGIATAVLVAVATAARWGAPWLGAIGGAQAVLGPGGLVGPEAAAASAWLGAAALVLATPGRSYLAAIALGTTAAFLVAGPAGTGGILVRIVASVVLSALAVAVGRQPRRRLPAVVALVLAAVAAVLALA